MNLGRIAIVAQGSYSLTRPYKKLDTVEFNGSMYVALMAIGEGESPIVQPTKWMLGAIAGKDFKFTDFTQEQIELLQAPANDAISLVDAAVERANNATRNAAIGIKGEATQTNAPTVYTPEAYPNGLFETYIVRTPLTLPNNWGSAVTQAELDANYVFFDVRNGVITKVPSKKPVADPAKLPLYSAIKSANIVAGTQFIDDENGNIQYKVKTGQTLNVGEKPENVIGSKVDRDAIDFYNVTVNKPLTAGNYYTSATAKNAVPNGYKQQGTIITYLTASKTVERIGFSGIATEDADVVIVLDGVTYNVPILSGDTNEVIGGKMRAFVFDGWTMSGFDSRAVFTKNVGGQTQLTRVTSPIGVSGKLITVTYGEDEKWISEQFGGKSSEEWTDATKWKTLNQVNTYNFQKTV